MRFPAIEKPSIFAHSRISARHRSSFIIQSHRLVNRRTAPIAGSETWNFSRRLISRRLIRVSRGEYHLLDKLRDSPLQLVLIIDIRHGVNLILQILSKDSTGNNARNKMSATSDFASTDTAVGGRYSWCQLILDTPDTRYVLLTYVRTFRLQWRFSDR